MRAVLNLLKGNPEKDIALASISNCGLLPFQKENSKARDQENSSFALHVIPSPLRPFSFEKRLHVTH